METEHVVQEKKVVDSQDPTTFDVKSYRAGYAVGAEDSRRKHFWLGAATVAALGLLAKLAFK